MDFFKFNPVTDPTILENGELINNLDRTLWVERYRDPGEFSFEGKVSAGLRDFLPKGTLISHVDTLEVMIVESHQISETQEDDPTIVVTGRSFPSHLENRAVGVNQARTSSTRTTYEMGTDFVHDQIVILINDHISTPVSSDDELENVLAETDLVSVGKPPAARPVEFGSLWERVLELLRYDDLGIKTIRRNTFGVGSDTYTTLLIYRGIDRSKEVLFSWKSGDLEAAQYLFSNKNAYTSALVLGQYVVMMVDDPAKTKYDRRIMVVDGSDIDGYFGAMPVGVDLTNVEYGLTIRGYLAIVNQTDINIMQTDMSKTAKYQYRRDFNIGDLISLDGNYGQLETFRIVEYAEVEDENGESGHPTLAVPGEE
jgi:hypothetical protein